MYAWSQGNTPQPYGEMLKSSPGTTKTFLSNNRVDKDDIRTEKRKRFIRHSGETFTNRNLQPTLLEEDGGVSLCCGVHSERNRAWGPLIEGCHINPISETGTDVESDSASGMPST